MVWPTLGSRTDKEQEQEQCADVSGLHRHTVRSLSTRSTLARTGGSKLAGRSAMFSLPSHPAPRSCRQQTTTTTHSAMKLTEPMSQCIECKFFFTARRHASAVFAVVVCPVSVRLTVCHKPALYRNDWTNRAGL